MMRRTSTSDIVVPFVAVTAIVYLLLRASYSSLPPFQWLTALPIAGLAVVEFAIARRVRLAVRHVPGARPMTVFAIARSVALGKASSLVGSGVAGAALALVLTVLPDSQRTSAAGHDLWVGLVLLLAAAMVTVAGLVLERAGIDPNIDRRP